MPKVSVIVPVYGVEKYIERCARSLFEQTLADIEYLFIDDCTPDKSVEKLRFVLEEYPQRKEQVVIHRMEKNSGQACAREWGICHATGEYIIHCDSDDWIDKNLYQDLYECAIEKEADIAVCDFKTSDGVVSETHAGLKESETFLSDMMYSKVTWSLCNKLIKKSVYYKGYIPPAANVGEDMAIVLQLMKFVNKVAYLPNAYYYYYYNSNSTMNVTSEEKIYDKYVQMCSNVDVICKAFQEYKSDFEVGPKLSAIKLYCQVLMVPILNNNNIGAWNIRNNFPIWKTLLDCNVRFRYKAIYIAYKIGIYGFVKRIKR